MIPIPRPSSSRRDRSCVTSPVESLASIAISNGSSMKRKERDFENDDEETNIYVVVRCRGRNEREVKENSGVVLSTNGIKSNSLELHTEPNILNNKTYHFDRVFSSAADQAMIYDDVVTPILEEMLLGYNCTIFAYGQTGTGKTYTMSGDTTEKFNMLSDAAGVIPRALRSLFTKLEQNNSEWSVKCSFIELYNEELRDLISPDDSTKLKIYDDYSNKKGCSSTIVQGMEETHIRSAADGIRLLKSGSLKRQVAATKCNELSSRSHTVFTITAFIKRTAENGEDYISAGKLNLVDLAGSENIQRSGAENKRAAEAGLINKSLLTLGRVINALVDKNSHIPYRESKLTRLLQDSLGGRTKTCIIATVSPAKSNLEETISTLDYAFRAKNIRNKPQTNQMINKKTLLREFTVEIEKLKSELAATRQRNGVYLSNESYEEMTQQSESRRILSEEQAAKIEMMEMNLHKKVQELFSITSSFMDLKKDNEGAIIALDESRTLLEQTEHVLEVTRKSLVDENIIRKAHQETEQHLSSVGNHLISTLNQTVNDINCLHAKNSRNSDLQSINLNTWDLAKTQVSEVTSFVEDKVQEFKAQQQELITTILASAQNSISSELEKISKSCDFLEKSNITFESSKNDAHEKALNAEEQMGLMLSDLTYAHEDLKARSKNGLKDLSVSIERISTEVTKELNSLHTQLQNSYNVLGQDFNSLFRSLLERLKLQYAEANTLRQQLTKANEFAIQSNITDSTFLENLLEEERNQAANDRQNLLLQITDLIKAQGESQEDRLNAKIIKIREDTKASIEKLECSRIKYEQEMENWNQKEERLIEEISVSQDCLRRKIEENLLATDIHKTCLQDTTHSMYNSTFQNISSQIEDIENQVHVLEDLVAHIRLKSNQYHRGHEVSLNSLSATVHSSHLNLNSHFTSSHECLIRLGEDMKSRSDLAQQSLERLQLNTSQPLGQLRKTISGMNLREYQATGETPQKTQYIYPTTLPQTGDREKILQQLREASEDQILGDAPLKVYPIISNDEFSITRDQQVSFSPHPSPELVRAGRREQVIKNSLHDLKEINVNISKLNGVNFCGKESSTRSKRTLSGLNTLNEYGKCLTKGKKNMITLEGKENVATAPQLILPLATGRRRSPRTVSKTLKR